MSNDTTPPQEEKVEEKKPTMEQTAVKEEPTPVEVEVPVEEKKSSSIGDPDPRGHYTARVKMPKFRSPRKAVPENYRLRNTVKPIPGTDVDDKEWRRMLRDFRATLPWPKNDKDTLEDSERKVQAFLEYYRGAYSATWPGNDRPYSTFYRREDSEYVQKLDTPDGSLYTHHSVPHNRGKREMTGAAGIQSIRSAIGLGVPVTATMHASCFTLTLGGFKNSELLALTTLMHNANVSMGYETSGWAMDPTDSTITMTIVDEVLSHVTACNVSEWMPGEVGLLKGILKDSDIQHLLAAALESIYPNGYPTVHRCKNTAHATCDYISPIKKNADGVSNHIDSLLQFQAMAVTDASMLSTEVREFTGKPKTMRTVEEILKMQDKVANQKRTIKVSVDDVDFTIYLRSASIALAESFAELWQTNIREMADNALNSIEDMKEAVRRRKRITFINQFSEDMALTALAVNIASIEYLQSPDDDEPKEVTDTDTIIGALSELSTDTDFVTQLEDKVSEFRNDSIVTMTGTENWECPSCHSGQLEDEEALVGLIPCNMVRFFFVLMGWRWGQR